MDGAQRKFIETGASELVTQCFENWNSKTVAEKLLWSSAYKDDTPLHHASKLIAHSGFRNTLTHQRMLYAIVAVLSDPLSHPTQHAILADICLNYKPMMDNLAAGRPPFQEDAATVAKDAVHAKESAPAVKEADPATKEAAPSKDTMRRETQAFVEECALDMVGGAVRQVNDAVAAKYPMHDWTAKMHAAVFLAQAEFQDTLTHRILVYALLSAVLDTQLTNDAKHYVINCLCLKVKKVADHAAETLQRGVPLAGEAAAPLPLNGDDLPPLEDEPTMEEVD